MTTQGQDARIRQRMAELVAQGVPAIDAIRQATQEVSTAGGAPQTPGAGVTPPGSPGSPTPPGFDFPLGQGGPTPGLDDFTSPGVDPFTGGITDDFLNEFLRQEQGTVTGRRGLYEDILESQQGYYDLPGRMRDFSQGLFYPLEAQYAAASALDPSTPDFLSFLQGGQRGTLGGDQWRDVLGQLGQTFGGVGSADQLAGLSPLQQAQYGALRQGGASILAQAIQSQLNPLLARHAGNVLRQRLNQWGSALGGAPSNQWNFVLEQLPQWRDVLGQGLSNIFRNAPVPQAPPMFSSSQNPPPGSGPPDDPRLPQGGSQSPAAPTFPSQSMPPPGSGPISDPRPQPASPAPRPPQSVATPPPPSGPFDDPRVPTAPPPPPVAPAVKSTTPPAAPPVAPVITPTPPVPTISPELDMEEDPFSPPSMARPRPVAPPPPRPIAQRPTPQVRPSGPPQPVATPPPGSGPVDDPRLPVTLPTPTPTPAPTQDRITTLKKMLQERKQQMLGRPRPDIIDDELS